MGNVHLKWAFSEAAVLFVRHSEPGKELLARLEKRHGQAARRSASLAHKLGRAAYYDQLLRGKAFEIERFVATVTGEVEGCVSPLPNESRKGRARTRRASYPVRPGAREGVGSRAHEDPRSSILPACVEHAIARL